MRSPDEVVFLFDVDNTLLDNDRVDEDLRRYEQVVIIRIAVKKILFPGKNFFEGRLSLEPLLSNIAKNTGFTLFTFVIGGSIKWVIDQSYLIRLS